MNTLPKIIHYPDLVPYAETYAAMQAFNASRTPQTPDQYWLLEHQAVYTLGRASKTEHLLNTGSIPVIQTDRGGQVSYHGPGQLIVYPLLDLRRRQGWHAKRLVERIEQAIIDFLASLNIQAQRRQNAPGVYVDEAKIAALGLRIRQGCCYHGLSLNVDVDLTPFQGINPCGYQNLAITRLADLGVDMTVAQTAQAFIPFLLKHLDIELTH